MNVLTDAPPGAARTATAPAPGTVTATGSGPARVGLLDGRDFAATRARVDGPGRFNTSTHTSTGETVQTWVVGNREVTNRAGAREYLGLSANTVTMYFSPAGRRRYGTPEPLEEQVEGQDVWALDELAAFKQTRQRRPATPAPVAGGDPDELIGVTEFAELLREHRDTTRRRVRDSVDAWERGEDALLPVPDDSEPHGWGGRMRYRWRRGRAEAFAAQPRPTGGGRPAATEIRPTVADLQAVEAAARKGERPTVRELATALSTRLGATVTPQMVQRLRRRAREDQASS
jgi:hypothetical protein